MMPQYQLTGLVTLLHKQQERTTLTYRYAEPSEAAAELAALGLRPQPQCGLVFRN